MLIIQMVIVKDFYFLACLAAFSIFVVRSEESENGIDVFDSNGNSVGVSKEAGFKVGSL